MKYCSVVPHEVVENLGDSFSKNPVGTGPFKFKRWDDNIKMVLTKNENYFEIIILERLGLQNPYII